MVTKPVDEIKVVGVNVKPVVDASKRAWWAYLGAWGLAQDEVEALSKRLIERGSTSEKQGRKLLDEALDWPQKSLKTVEAELQGQIEVVLKRFGVLTQVDVEKMNLPTRADIQALSEKVAALTKKVEALRKQEEPKAPPVKAPAPSHKASEVKKAVVEAVGEAEKSAEAVVA